MAEKIKTKIDRLTEELNLAHFEDNFNNGGKGVTIKITPRKDSPNSAEVGFLVSYTNEAYPNGEPSRIVIEDDSFLERLLNGFVQEKEIVLKSKYPTKK